MDELKNIFEIFVKLLVKLQGQIYTTLNRGLIYIYILYKNLNDLKVKFERQKNIKFQNAINNGIEKLKKIFST